jgi:hypothetical protein
MEYLTEDITLYDQLVCPESFDMEDDDIIYLQTHISRKMISNTKSRLKIESEKEYIHSLCLEALRLGKYSREWKIYVATLYYSLSWDTFYNFLITALDFKMNINTKYILKETNKSVFANIKKMRNELVIDELSQELIRYLY